MFCEDLCSDSLKCCIAFVSVFIRYARAAVQTLLKGACLSNERDAVSHDTSLPHLTADLLLQPHLGLFPFPLYFSALHEFLAAFYHTGRKVEGNAHKSKPQDSLLFLRNEVGYTVEQVDIAASFLPDLLSIVDDEGIKLLLYHLEPLFTCLETRLHACTQLFDMLAQALGPKNTIKAFLKCLVSLFDSHALDIYEVITKQTFLSQIIVRFGLDGFLKHVISFVVDAVSFNSKMESKGDKGDRLSVYSAEGIGSGIALPEMEYTTKDVPLDIDELDLPGDFLREGSEDRDLQIGSFSMGIEEFETQREFAVTRKNLGQARGDEEKDEVKPVTLLPRCIIDDEGDGRSFEGHVSDDEDNAIADNATERGRAGKVAVIKKICDGEGGVDVEDRSTSGSASTTFSTGQGIASNIDITEGKELKAGIDNACDASCDASKEQDDLGMDLLQNNSDEVSEAFKGEARLEIEMNNMTGRHVTRQGNRKDKRDGVTEERNEGHVPDKTSDSFTTDNNEELDETEGNDNGNDNDSLANISFPEGDVASEEDEGEPSSEDESRDNAIDPEDDGANKNDQLTSTYEIKTFYNGTKPKPMQQEKKVQKQHDELTPGAISGIAAESIIWLAPRLGPVLTSKYIASQLLTMLPHCYLGYVGTNDDDDDVKTVSDSNAKWVLFCLSNFCTLYGEAFLLNQYLPYIDKTVS